VADNIESEEEKGPDIRSLRQAAEAGKQAQQELSEIKRQLMFAKAGIDWENDKLGKLLYKTWEGDDLDSLRSEAAEIGIGRTGSAPADDSVREQAEFRRNLSAGAPAGAYEPPSRDPRDEAMEQFHDDRRRGVPREQAALAAFDRIFTAAVAGDERVIFDPNTWQNDYRV
jgi:hypothetical protein